MDICYGNSQSGLRGAVPALSKVSRMGWSESPPNGVLSEHSGRVQTDPDKAQFAGAEEAERDDVGP